MPDPVLTPEQMYRADNQATEKLGLIPRHLMEVAGLECARIIRQRYGSIPVLVVCGSGNNGGDGLVVARWLYHWGNPVTVWMFGNAARFSPETAANYQLCQKQGINITPVGVDHDFLSYDLIVDAIYGIGFKGEPESECRRLLSYINSRHCPCVSLDIPSGVNAASGMVVQAVRADLTLAIAALKPGHMFGAGFEHCGQLQVVDIGIPGKMLENSDIRYRLASGYVWPVRNAYAHKGISGRVGIVAGSPGLSGAAILCAKSALRAGAGLVTVFCPQSEDVAINSQLAEAMTSPYNPEQPVWPQIAAKVKNQDVLLLGPGLGQAEYAAALLDNMLAGTDCRVILDADALNLLATHPEWLPRLASRALLTPHPKEFCRLTGLDSADFAAKALATLEEYASDHHLVVMLKGASTAVVASGRVCFIPGACAALARGGSGDVLSGFVASLLLATDDLAKAATLGTVLLLNTARRLAAKQGDFSPLAGEIADAAVIPPPEIPDPIIIKTKSWE